MIDKNNFVNEPYNIEIEQVILGAILNDNSSYDKISDLIKGDDFYDLGHREIFKAIKYRLENSQVADILTLSGILSEANIPTQYVVDLTNNIYSIDNIKQYAEILIELSHRRKLIKFGQQITQNASNQSIPINEQVEIAEQNIFSINEKSTTNKVINFFDGASNILKFTQSIVHSNRKINGLPTGFSKLDNILGGLKPGELIILAGRPAMGKTAFSTNIATNIALNNKGGGPVLFISLEMPYEQICLRIISSISSIPLTSLTHAKISANALSDCIIAMEKYKNMPLYILDSSFLSIGGLRSILRTLKRKHNISLVILDYLQLLDSGIRKESREQEISVISRMLKLSAKEIHIPIIALSQMSRDIEKRKDSSKQVKLSDLRGSGALEQDADVVLFINEVEENNKELVKIVIAKNRNGALEEIVFRYYAEITTFRELNPITS